MAIEIVDLPIKNGGSVDSYVNAYQSVEEFHSYLSVGIVPLGNARVLQDIRVAQLHFPCHTRQPQAGRGWRARPQASAVAKYKNI